MDVEVDVLTFNSKHLEQSDHLDDMFWGGIVNDYVHVGHLVITKRLMDNVFTSLWTILLQITDRNK